LLRSLSNLRRWRHRSLMLLDAAWPRRGRQRRIPGLPGKSRRHVPGRRCRVGERRRNRSRLVRVQARSCPRSCNNWCVIPPTVVLLRWWGRLNGCHTTPALRRWRHRCRRMRLHHGRSSVYGWSWRMGCRYCRNIRVRCILRYSSRGICCTGIRWVICRVCRLSWLLSPVVRIATIHCPGRSRSRHRSCSCTRSRRRWL
jgi:hypothetical protein